MNPSGLYFHVSIFYPGFFIAICGPLSWLCVLPICIRLYFGSHCLFTFKNYTVLSSFFMPAVHLYLNKYLICRHPCSLSCLYRNSFTFCLLSLALSYLRFFSDSRSHLVVFVFENKAQGLHLQHWFGLSSLNGPLTTRSLILGRCIFSVLMSLGEVIFKIKLYSQNKEATEIKRRNQAPWAHTLVGLV